MFEHLLLRQKFAALNSFYFIVQYGLRLLLIDRSLPRFLRFTGEVDLDESRDSDRR